jgi:TetR/AcrR family transcriptional regulator, copper-responsive repressor
MVQKSDRSSAKPAAPKRRGRPRAYEPDRALGQALDLFRKSGLAATSLDDLSAATGMNRPSLYGAFGDKRELYLKSLARYRADARAALAAALAGDLPLRKRLKRVYDIALDIYLSGADGPRGCFTVMTATSEAIADPEIRGVVQEALGELDKAFAGLIKSGKDRGELPETADPRMLAQFASATIHTLAIRARAGTPREALEKIAKGAVELICGRRD